MNNKTSGRNTRKEDITISIEEAERRDMKYFEDYCRNHCYESHEIAPHIAMLNDRYQQTLSPIVSATITNIQNEFRFRRYGNSFTTSPVMLSPSLPNQPSTVEGQDVEQSALNFNGPLVNIQRMLSSAWFQLVCSDNRKYNKEWLDRFVADLMASEHGEYIARKWAMKAQSQQIRAHVLGVLLNAGVMKGKSLQVARYYQGISDKTNDKEKTKAAKTTAKYMGDGLKEPYFTWIIDYVSKG